MGLMVALVVGASLIVPLVTAQDYDYPPPLDPPPPPAPTRPEPPAIPEPPEAPVPHFQAEGNTYQGRHVTFTYDPTTGVVTDFARTGSEPIFSSVTVVGASPVGDPLVVGSIFRANLTFGMIQIHDNPTGLIQVYLNHSTTVEYILGAVEGRIDDRVPGNRSVLVEQDGKPLGVLFSAHGTVDLTEEGIEVELQEPGLILFRMAPVISRGAEVSLLLGVAAGRIKAEVTLAMEDGRLDADRAIYRPSLQVDPYGSRPNRVVVVVSDDEREEGTVLLLRLHRSIFSVTSARQVTITFDDEVVPVAATLEDVLFQTGRLPSDVVAFTLEDPVFLQVLVYIPGFSTHVIAVQGIPPGAIILDNPSIIALGVGALVAVLAGVALLRRRR
jgi:hypothetical protein